MADFRKYCGMDTSTFLRHYGVGHEDGGHSGRYPWGSGENPKQRTVFISGSSKTQDKESGYYRKRLPKPVRDKIDQKMRNGDKIIVGDAPGIDRQVQDYLKSKKYKNVEVYGPGKQVRYSADKNWKTNPIDDPDHEPMSPEWLAKKDKAMTDAADEGLAIILDEGAKATRNNIERLNKQEKPVDAYMLSKGSELMDRWLKENEKKKVSDLLPEFSEKALLEREEDSPVVKALSKISPYLAKQYEKNKGFTVKDTNGKSIGSLYLNEVDEKELNIEWIGIDEKARGKGYAQSALKQTISYAKENGFKEVTLEVPGISPDAMHIYKKLGFVEDGTLTEDDIWGGLTKMRLVLR